MPFFRAALLCALLSCASTALIAAEPPPPEPVIIVTALSVQRAAEAEAARTPGGTDIVSHADYADRTALSLRDALAYSPGVYSQPRYGQEVRISIRGSGLSRGFHMRGLTLLQDEVPINLADDNGDFQELEPIFFDHLAVYRGANALRFGSGTLGGAVNGVTPSGRSAPGLYSRLDAGSFETARGLVAYGAADAAGDLWAALSYDQSNGDRRHARRDSLRFHGNAGLALAPQLATRFYASVNAIDQELPGALTRAVALSDPRRGNFAGDQARDIDSIRLQNRTRFAFAGGTLEAGGFVNAKSLYHPIFQVVDQESLDHGVFARLEWARGPVELTLGGDYRRGSVRARRFVNIGGDRGALTFDADQDARTASLYGEARVRPLPALTLIAGLIYADGWREQHGRFPVASLGRADFAELSPRFGLLWDAGPHTQFFANASRSAEFPGFIELAQGSFDPVFAGRFVPVAAQTGWSYEVGARGRAGDVAGWDIALYRADLTGELLQFSNGDIGALASTFNAGRTRHQGVEAALTLTPAPWLRLRQSYQYSDFTFRDDATYGDNRLPVIPDHAYRAELRLGDDALHVAPAIEWVPRGAFADYRNSSRVPGYALFSLSAGAAVAPGVDLFVDARNLGDRKAIGDISAVVAASPASAIYQPVERRALFAGVRARL